MFLKRLDVLGFKSFADRIELDIVPGVTAVVGPNGSGKSNISDAIRWVLGEQSAKSLRGAKMEDVIFAGSETRKAVNFCEVALTLDNSDGALPVDFSEVSVTRRVYRNGDSEYLVNGQSVRLRDVSELFMDTGVGKEAYSIIGQGRIEEILSTKSEDRRGVFEEAAGIVKFKARRKEAERKLLEAEQNVIRVRDILFELKNQLEPLRQKAELENKYQSLRERLVTLQISVLVAEIDELLQKRTAAADRLAVLQNELAAALSKESDNAASLAELRGSMNELDQALQGVHNRLVTATSGVEQCEADRRVAFERQEHAIAALEELHATREKLQQEVESVNLESIQEDIRAEQLQERISSLKQELDAKLSGLDSQSVILALRGQVNEARTQLIESMRQQASDRNELSKIDNTTLLNLKRLERVEMELAQLNADAGAARNEAKDLELARVAILEERTRLEQSITVLQDMVVQKKEQVNAASKRERDLENLRLELKSRLHTLQDLQKDLEGYAGGPKAVLQGTRQNHLRGIRGSVADLVRVKPEHQLGIETALGASLQHIVVETEEQARQAIEWLKKRQLGRATFLPISTIRGRKMPPHDVQMVKTASGFVGVAADLVEVDKVYQNIMDSLLGTVILARSLPEANTIARILMHRVRIVTLGGDVVNAGGSMTGGSVSRRGAGILGRAQEIQELTNRLQDSSTQLATISQQRIANEQDHDECVHQLQHAEAKLRSFDVRLRALEADETALRHRIDANSGRESALELERHDLSQEIVDFQKASDELRVKLELDAQQIAAIEAQTTDLEQQIVQHESSEAGRSDVLTDLRVKLAGAQEASRANAETRERLASRLASLNEELARLQSDEKRLLGRISDLRLQLETYQQEGLLAQSIREQLQVEADSLRKGRSESLQAVDDREKLLARAAAERRGVEERLHAHELTQSRLAIELESKVAELSQDYNLGLELARERFSLAQPLTAARSGVASLKRDIEGLGTVSVGAMDEYERLMERFTFLSAQEADLADAQAQLRALIVDIDREMAHRFLETFEAVRGHFASVFSSLFGGGRADISLVDQSQPLTTGIEIVAEPAGKKMQALSLLSGGERALTALALLFAILKIKPVPFCILDEVEAALDEANVTRFADYLHAFSHQTQFIVITHRRGTMEAADVLYGVTMQESGVSKLVSVRVLDEEQVSA